MSNKLVILLFILIISSCVMDRKSEVVIIANDTGFPLTVVKQPDQIITDSLVFYNSLDNSDFVVGEMRSIWLPYASLKGLSDDEKVYFYIFNADLLDSYRNKKMISGIMKKCLVKTFSVQLNKVTNKLDTVYVSK